MQKKMIERKQTIQCNKRESTLACLFLSIWLQLDPSTRRQQTDHDNRTTWRRDGRTRKKTTTKHASWQTQGTVHALCFFPFPLSVFFVVVYINKVILNTRFFSPLHLLTLNSVERGREWTQKVKGKQKRTLWYLWYDTRTYTWARQAKQAPQKRVSNCSMLFPVYHLFSFHAIENKVTKSTWTHTCNTPALQREANWRNCQYVFDMIKRQS